MEKKRKANIFENCTCHQVNMARNPALQINNAHLYRSRCNDSIYKKRQENCLIRGEMTEENKALCFFSETGVI